MLLLTLLLTQIAAKKGKLSKTKKNKTKEAVAVADEPVNTEEKVVPVDSEVDAKATEQLANTDAQVEAVKEEDKPVDKDAETKPTEEVAEPVPVKEEKTEEPIVNESEPEPTKTEKNEKDILAPPTHNPNRQTFFGFLFFVFGSLVFVGALCLLFSAFYYRYELQRTKQVPFETPEFLRMIFPNPVREEIEINNLCMKYLDN